MYRTVMPALSTLLVCSACATSQPTLSHAHIGHSLTGWHDTPDQAGLFVVAERESRNALDEIALAQRSVADVCAARDHVKNVVHSLNPELEPTGTGLGYGALRALEGARKHVGFAAETKDASESVVYLEQEFGEHAAAATDQLLIALATARSAIAAPPGEIASRLPELEDALRHGVYGKDLDHDGIVGSLPEESGVVQLRMQLSDLIANEVEPPYRPVSKRHLFGVTRNDEGHWVYDFDSAAH